MASEIPVAKPLGEVLQQCSTGAGDDDTVAMPAAEVAGIFEDWDETGDATRLMPALKPMLIKVPLGIRILPSFERGTSDINLPTHLREELDQQPPQTQSGSQSSSAHSSSAYQAPPAYGNPPTKSIWSPWGLSWCQLASADARHKKTRAIGYYKKRVNRDPEPTAEVSWDEPFSEPRSSIGLRLLAAMVGIALLLQTFGCFAIYG